MSAVAAAAVGYDNPFVEFRIRYYHDPVAFVREVLGAEPDQYQQELLNAIARGERRIAERSGHGVGKTTGLSFAVTWFANTRFPQKTVCTAATGPQLFDALVPEIKRWFGRLPEAIQALFDVKSDRIELIANRAESYISFRTSREETPEAMAGVHSDNVLIIGDEASGIPDAVYIASVGSMSSHNACMVLTGNPVRTSGFFYDAFHDLADMWYRIHVSCVGHPNVDQDMVAQIARTYGERSNEYRVRVLGEFPLGDADTVIPFELTEAALNRDVQATKVRRVWGVDCARFGDDGTALARRQGNVLIQPVEEKWGLDTMQTVGWVKNEWDTTSVPDRPVEINVDSIGIGAGVVDRLRELGLPARGINVAEAPALGDEHLNLRAELWFKGRAWLAARDCSLGGDKALASELVKPRYSYTSSGKKQVESKQDMKKRKVKSPNKADAFLLTFATDAVIAAHGSAAGTSWAKALKRSIKGLV